MDKALEIVVAASVILVTALIVLFIFSGQSGSFGQFLGNQSQQAKCDLWEKKYNRMKSDDIQGNEDIPKAKYDQNCPGTLS